MKRPIGVTRPSRQLLDSEVCLDFQGTEPVGVGIQVLDNCQKSLPVIEGGMNRVEALGFYGGDL